MDYDGNDTQGHNLNVASEGTSKSSSVLRPYAFPRFDIDESLQGHLRFDSLVETDVFLGIQSQDDNQWIEDFSRGSDVIDFSSSASESCSIARQNNVWSEATSSESVEMLLKSVGQEQIQPKDPVSESSSTCNKLCGLVKEMEPNFEQDNVNGESTRISNATMLQDDLLNNFSGLENHVETKLSQVDGISLSQEKVVQRHESSSQMRPIDLKEECKFPVTGGILLPDSGCGIKNVQGAECPVAVSLDQAADGLSHSTWPAKDIYTSSNILVPLQSPDLVSSHSEGTDTEDGIKEQLAPEEMVHADTQILEQHKPEDAMHTECLTSSVECADKKTDMEVIFHSNESSMMSCGQECQFRLLERRDKDNSPTPPTLPGSGQSEILSTSKMRSASTGSDSVIDNSEGHATKLGNPNAEQCSRSEANEDSVEELDPKFSSDVVDNMIGSSLKDGGQGNLVLESYSQSSSIIGVNKSSTDKFNNANIIDLGESLAGPVSSSSVGLNKETDGAESIQDLHDASAVNMGGSRSSGCREDFQVEADQQSNATESENNSVKSKKEENISLPTFVIDASSGTCAPPTRDLGSSAMVRYMSNDEPIVNQPHSENVGNLETEANGIPCKINGSTIDGNNEDIHRQVAAEVGSACEAKSGIHRDSTTPPLSGTEVKLIPVMETCNVASGSKSSTSNIGDCSKRSEVHPDCDDSALIKGGIPEGFSSESLKLECNSPTMINSGINPPDECKLKGDGGSDFTENKPSAFEDPNGKDTSLDDNSFTFKVNSTPNAEREKAITWTPFPIAETYKASVVVEEVKTPYADKIQARLTQETSGNNPGGYTPGISKAASGRKRRGSGKGAAKENSQKGVIIKETAPDRASHKKEKSSIVPLSPGSSLPDQFIGSQHGLTNHKRKKQSTKNVVPTCNLPDLNALALKNHGAPSTAFYQPFTELQQVQLRAQIFVYGSLIQGTAPDEACMISAFGSFDRGRGVWGVVWQAAVDRVRSKKSQPGGESPMSFHSSGAKVPELSGKQDSPETKVFPSSASRAGCKGTPTAILNPIIPFSSPLWSISTSYHDVTQSSNLQKRPVLHNQPAISPRQPYHTPPVQNIIGYTNQQSQVHAFLNPWALPTPAISVNARFPTTVITETVKLTPVKDFSLPAPSFVQNVPSSLAYTDTTSTVYTWSSLLPDQIKGSMSSEAPPSNSKPRRRKKAQPLDSTPQNPLFSQAHTETIVATSLPTLTSPLALVSSPSGPVTLPMGDVIPDCSTSQQQVGNLDARKSSACSVETLRKVEDARLFAEEAAVSAATSISHCQSLWSQLAKQDSRMAREAEAQISAAAGAVAAAAFVAKAAAAAARVASNAALQAKLMADEAFIPSTVRDVAQKSITQIVGSGTPMSILTTDGVTNQFSSILVGTKEAGKGNIFAASAAVKQDEYLRSILEAAKLAAEAVSQAGKVVAMGEPLPLKELISAGPEGYWKLPQASSELVTKSGNRNDVQMNVGSAHVADISHEECGGPSGGKILDHGRILMDDPSNDSFGNNTRSERSVSELIGVGDKDPGGVKSHKVSDVVQSNRELSVLGNSSGTIDVQNQLELGTDHGSNIKEGSAVEVYKDGEGIKPAWLSANVLTLHDGKALIQYMSLLSKEGSDNLKEWVALEGEVDKAPRIRASLPMTASHLQGTRKRRRSAVGNNFWMVGDMVDVRIQDSWYEGIVTEKNENDEATLTVHFPARGETSAVSTQQLRFSRIWTDGNWVQWSRLRGHDCSNESDMPLEKRARLKSPFGKNKSEGAELVVRKPEESKLQALAASDMVFNVGKSKPATKPDARRPWKTGLQKEGSRAVFGVPKPGKKQKFVEVSKHFHASQNGKNNESKEQVKFAKYLMPQGTASRGGKYLPKADSKEKQSLRVTSLKPRSSSSRTVPQRDNLVKSAPSQCDEAMPFSGLGVEKSVVQREDTSKTTSVTGRGSSGTCEAGKEPLGSSFMKCSSNNKPDLSNNEKLAPAGAKLTRVDEKNVYNDNTDSTQVELEPRRSNRRIQPTHRLLEGLQSSLIIPKMTSVSHDKVQGQGQKSGSTSAFSRGK